MMRTKVFIAAALVVAMLTHALAGSATVTIPASGVSGSSPGPYTVTLSSVSGITTGDDFGGRLGSGAGAIYKVTAINPVTNTLTIADVRTGSYGGPFGPPSTGSAWYGTPSGTGGEHGQLARPPFRAVGWDAIYALNDTLVGQRVLARAGAASVSSSTSAFASARTVHLPSSLWSADGTGVEVTANLRLAAGSGVNLRLQVGTTSGTTLTTAGLHQFRVIREDSNTLMVYSGDTARDSAGSTPLSLPYVSLNLQIQGGSVAGGSANDFWVVRLLE